MPLGHAEIGKTHEAHVDPIAKQAAAGTVRIWGVSDDLIEIEGDVSGCDEYNAEDAHFMVVGESTQVRIRCWYTKRGVWAISASQAGEGVDILPVTIAGGQSTYSPVAQIERVRVVIHENEGK